MVPNGILVAILGVPATIRISIPAISLSRVEELKKKGLSEKEILETLTNSLPMTSIRWA